VVEFIARQRDEQRIPSFSERSEVRNGLAAAGIRETSWLRDAVYVVLAAYLDAALLTHDLMIARADLPVQGLRISVAD
jgi:hypothetical protein